MRGRVVALAGLALVALLPASGNAGTVAADIQVSATQDQAGKEIKVAAFVEAHEQLTVTGHGTVRIGGELRQLRPKGGARELPAESGYSLKLRPTSKVARQIARALTEGRILHASFTVTLTNAAAVTQTTHYRVKLTKFRG
jgi:hypothetical protein